MIVDSSAIIAILRTEPGWERLEAALLGAAAISIAAGTMLETRIVAIRLGIVRRLDDFLAGNPLQIVPTDHRQVDLAAEGLPRFGKGRHPAGLNFGDCFAYALARLLDEPLLLAGRDFAQTDLKLALR